MPDYRTFFDRDYIGAWDLPGDVTVTISKVEGRELISAGGRKTRKPVVWFEGKEKGLALNKTNSKIIATLYGNDTAGWVGKRVTLYPTKTSMGPETVDCVRVRPTVPPEKGAK